MRKSGRKTSTRSYFLCAAAVLTQSEGGDFIAFGQASANLFDHRLCCTKPTAMSGKAPESLFYPKTCSIDFH